MPGVDSAGVVKPLPLALDEFDTTGYEVEEQPVPRGMEPYCDRYILSPSFFRTAGIRLVKGRLLTNEDRDDTQPVMVISETLAHKHWPHQDVIGKRIRLPWNPGRKDAPWRTIVGVVRDVKQYGLDRPNTPQLYVPIAQYPVSYMSLVVRTSGSPAALLQPVRNAVLALDRDQPPFDAKTMKDVLADSIALRRFSMLLLGVFAAVALALAAVGIYGVVAYSVSQRTHEIGVCMALGAQRLDVLRLILGRGFGLTLVGIAVGLATAFGVTHVMSEMLFQVAPTDTVTFASVSLILAGVALAACYVPARRASKVDPMVALRYE